MANRDIKGTVIRLTLLLALFEGTVVVWKLLMAPSEIQSVLFAGYSLPRLTLISIVFSLVLGMAVLFFRSFQADWMANGWGKYIEPVINRLSILWVLLVSGAMMIFLVFASSHILGDFAPYRERLYPIVLWFALISLQAIAGIIFIRGFGAGLFQVYRESFYYSAVIFGLAVLLIIFISLTKIGLSPDPIYWQGPGVPILLYQVILALVPGLLFNHVLIHFEGAGRARLDAAVYVGLWILATIVWWNQPARPSYNSLAPGVPNFQSYPFGDAILYDTVAHRLLIGTPMPNDFWVKPLYSTFLAVLHVFSGENYHLLILLQIFVLALIPVMVYVLVSLIGNHQAGIVASLLVIVRERNAIALANVIQVSHLKLLLSDVFSMGLVVLLLWVLFRWSQKPGERRQALLIAGGVLGLLILTRGHPIILFPLIAGIILLVKFPTGGQRWQGMVLFTLGTALTLIPWVGRVYETSGRLGIQSPVSPYSANLAGLYSLKPRLASPETFTTTISSQTLEQNDLQSKQIVEFIIQHPEEVFRFVSAHYFHNVIYSYIYLPQSFRIENLKDYIANEPFWNTWSGEFSAQGLILLFLNTSVLALGMGTAWKKHGVFAAVPLLVGMGYNLSVSVGRISGWRFILPVDWITLIYFSLGLIQLSRFLGFLLTRKIPDDTSPGFDPIPGAKKSFIGVPIIGSVFVFLLIGLAVPYGNKLFAGRNPAKPVQQLVDEFLSANQNSSSPVPAEALTDFLQEDHARILYGQAIYPYFLKENSGPINYYWPAYKPRPYNRVVFYLVGPESLNVVLPVSSPDFMFPDGADVIVLGCSDERGVVDAISVLIMGDSPVMLARASHPGLVCPDP